MLEAQGFDNPQPTIWNVVMLDEFCAFADFELGLVPESSLLMPPSCNYYDADAFNEASAIAAFNEASAMAAGGVDGPDRADIHGLNDVRAKLERLLEL